VTVLTDSRYAALASSAASGIGASSPAITRAILSQWQCELGANAPWPPTRNNPGNLARGFVSSLGYPFTVQTPNPQPGNPIVTFSSPQLGAQAYAAGIRTFSRYASTRAAAARGDGLGFLRAISAAGYGTGYSCPASVYNSSAGTGGGPNNGAGASQGGGTPTGTPVSSTARVFPYRKVLVTVFAGGGVTASTTITAGLNEQWALYTKEQNAGLLTDPTKDATWLSLLEQAAKPYIGKPAGSAPETLTVSGLPEPDKSSDPITMLADAISGFQAGLPGLIVSIGVLGVSAYLVVSGLSEVLGDNAELMA